MTTKTINIDSGIRIPASPSFPGVSSEGFKKTSQKVEATAVDRFHELLNVGASFNDSDEIPESFLQKLVQFQDEVDGRDADVNAAYQAAIGRKNSPSQKTSTAPTGAYQESPHGFPNLGNTCFANSAIQFLFNTPGIDEILNQKVSIESDPEVVHLEMRIREANDNPALSDRLETEKKRAADRIEFRQNLKALRAEYLKEAPNKAKIERLLNALWSSPLLNQLEMKIHQEDAREFLSIVYEILNIGTHPNFLTLTSSMVIDPKTGASKVTGAVRESIELSIPKGQPTLQGCFDDYLKTETLGMNETLNSHPTYTNKRMFFTGDAPETISFGLKRFTAANQKIQAPIKGFDQNILVPFCDDQGVQVRTENYIVDTVLCHAGSSSNSGHYVTLIKTEKGWRELNDRQERFLSERQALAIIETQGYQVRMCKK